MDCQEKTDFFLTQYETFILFLAVYKIGKLFTKKVDG